MSNASQNPLKVTLSEWDVRRLYNEGGIKSRERENKFEVTVKYGKPRIATRRIPAGSRSVKTRYFERDTGIQVGSFHHYESPEGKRIGRFDPKFLLIDNVEYHPRGHGKPEIPRIGNAEINRILGKRGLRARITYVYHCSEQTKKFWKEQVTNRLVRVGILESREWMLVWAL